MMCFRLRNDWGVFLIDFHFDSYYFFVLGIFGDCSTPAHFYDKLQANFLSMYVNNVTVSEREEKSSK